MWITYYVLTQSRRDDSSSSPGFYWRFYEELLLCTASNKWRDLRPYDYMDCQLFHRFTS